MANRWASGLLVGLGCVSLCPMAQAQYGPREPMPMNMAPAGGAPQGPMPLFGTGYGPGMPAMAPGGMPGMPGMPGMQGGPAIPMADPGMGGMPGLPGGPAFNGDCGPNGMPGVGLPMGGTYYPGISHDNRTSIWDKIFYSEDGERRRVYVKAGYIGLRRNGVADFPVVSRESIDNNIDGLGDPTFGVTPFIGYLSDASPGLNNGVQASIGLQDDYRCMIFEIGGFYLVNSETSKGFTSLGRLNSPYTNVPVGFQDTFGLWTNADFMNLAYKNSIYSGEINFRFFGDCWKTLDVSYLIGARYIKLQDQLYHYTVDDDLQLGINDPTTKATLGWRGENDMVGGQIGWSITQRFSPTWSMTWDQKIALLANGAKTTTSLVRGDGFTAYNVSDTTWRFAQAYEGGLYFDMNLGNMRLRAGYDLRIYTGVAQAQGQFTYDLQAAPTYRSTADTVIYHGPSATVEFVF